MEPSFRQKSFQKPSILSAQAAGSGSPPGPRSKNFTLFSEAFSDPRVYRSPMYLCSKVLFSPTRLAFGVLTFPEELVAEARTPRFRDEGAEHRCSAPPSTEGSAGFLKDLLWAGSVGFREVPRVPRVPRVSLRICFWQVWQGSARFRGFRGFP